MTHLARVEELIVDLEKRCGTRSSSSLRLTRGMAAQATAGYGTTNAVEDFARSLELCDR